MAAYWVEPDYCCFRVAPPEWVLVLFLPAILYWEALTTSTRTASRDARSVVLLAVVLVVATTAAVAACLHRILDIPWAVAFVVGAVLAPTDAAANYALAHLLPPRFMTLLRAESLINDGTALALLATAVPVAIGARHLDLLHISWAFAASYLGGVVFGVAVAGTALVAHRFLRDWMLSSVLSVLTPFVVYLLAEQIHTSGVIAVVTASFPACPAWTACNSASHSNADSAFLVTDYVCPQFGTVRLGGYSNPLRCR